MKNLRNILGGKKAQSNGKMFENYFKIACSREGISFTKIPDGCRQFGPNQMHRVKSPFDCVLSVNGVLFNKVALLDTKSCDAASFNHSNFKLHQLEELAKHEGPHVLSGYVIWFRKLDRMIFVSARHMLSRIGSKGSVSQKDIDGQKVIELGSSLDLKLRDRLFRA